MTARPADLPARPRDGYLQALLRPHRHRRKRPPRSGSTIPTAATSEDSLIRFRCRDKDVLTRVTRVNRYASFEKTFDQESVASVNPTTTREDQLANIRQIYPPEREALRGGDRHRAGRPTTVGSHNDYTCPRWPPSSCSWSWPAGRAASTAARLATSCGATIPTATSTDSSAASQQR